MTNTGPQTTDPNQMLRHEQGAQNDLHDKKNVTLLTGAPTDLLDV